MEVLFQKYSACGSKVYYGLLLVLSENLNCMATHDALVGMCAENPPWVRVGKECGVSYIENKTL